jgi:DNA repair exonuclease SbcCD ATPase subunit
MAKKVVGLEVTVDTPQADASVKSLRAQLKEAQADVVNLSEKFGQTSKEAQEAAKKAASLKDSIGDAKDLVDAFNPDAKFKAFGQAVNGVTGGFAALQGAMGLIGVESEGVEKSLLKVQSALALSQGVDQVLESVDAFKRFGAELQKLPGFQKAITAAQKLWNIAVAANPIGLLVVAITAAIAGITALVSWFSASSSAAKKNAAAVAESTAALENHKRALQESSEAMQSDSEFTIEMAKATGKSKDEVRKLILAEQDKKIALFESALATERLKLKQDEYTLSTLRAADADEDQIKKQEENVKATQDQIKNTTDAVANGYKDRLKISRGFQIEDAKEKIDAANKRKQDAKAAGDDARQKKEKAEQDRQDQIKAQKQLAEDLRLSALSEFDRDVANLNKQKLERIKIANGQKDLLLKIEQDYQRQLADIKKKRATITISGGEIETVEAKDPKDEAKTLLDQANSEQFSFEERLAKLQEREDLASKIVFDNEEARTAFTKENADTRIKIAEDEASEKIKQLQRGAALLSNISELVGKETAAGKAAAVASATIDTYAAAWSAFKAAQKNPISILGPAYPYIQAGLAVAGGIANIKKIIAVKVPNGGGGGGGGNLPSAPPISAAQNAPLPPQADTTQLNQASINAVGNASSRAYVLDSDITNNRDRITRLNRAARIN